MQLSLVTRFLLSLVVLAAAWLLTFFSPLATLTVESSTIMSVER